MTVETLVLGLKNSPGIFFKVGSHFILIRSSKEPVLFSLHSAQIAKMSYLSSEIKLATE